MKIGLSLGFCVRDIYNGQVDINEVLTIITRTACKDQVQIMDVIKHYTEASFRPLFDLDLAKCQDIALHLFTTGRLHQPRLISGDVLTNRNIELTTFWFDLVPSDHSSNPALAIAWDNYVTTRKLVANS